MSKWKAHNVRLVDQPDDVMCQPDYLKGKYFHLSQISIVHFQDQCEMVGGQLPTPKNKTELIELHTELKNALNSLKNEDFSECLDHQGNFVFYLGWLRNKNKTALFSPYNESLKIKIEDIIFDKQSVSLAKAYSPNVALVQLNGNRGEYVLGLAVANACGVCLLPKNHRMKESPLNSQEL